jgi:hypothetical protein
MYHTQLEKLESEAVQQGLFGGKIYFQHDNATEKLSQKKYPSLAGNCYPTRHIR